PRAPPPPVTPPLSLHDALPISCGLDLPVGDVGGLESLDAVLTEGHRRASLGGTSPPGVVLLAEFHSTRDQHVSALRSGLSRGGLDRKSTRLNSSHVSISYAVFC